MKRITFILNLKYTGSANEVETFIKDLSVPYTSECDEPGTNSFEWYLNKTANRAVLLENFIDSDAAVLRVKNLMESPVNESFQNLFEVIELCVLGDANPSLLQILEGWGPVYLNYSEGFNKRL